MSASGHQERPERQKKLTEKGAYMVLEKVQKLIQEADKTFNEAHNLVRESIEGKTQEDESTFDNLLEALAITKKAIEVDFDRLVLSQSADLMEDLKTISSWIEEIDDKKEELRRRFQEVPAIQTSKQLWQLAAGQLLENGDKRMTGASVASTSSTAVARAEAAAAKKRLEMEASRNALLAKHLEEEQKDKEGEWRRQAAKKKRELELETMKNEIEYQVAQTKLEALEERASSRAKSISSAMNNFPQGRDSIKDMQETKLIGLDDSRHEDQDSRRRDQDCRQEVYRAVNQDEYKWMSSMMETQRALLYGVPKLTPFSGNVEDFFAFMASWMATAGASGGNPAYKLQLLISNLDAKSRNLVSHCSYLSPEVGYEKAVDILYERYGRGDVLVDAFMEKLKKHPKIQISDAKALESFADQLDQSVMALQELSKRPGCSDYVCMASNVRNVAELLVKLPNPLRDRFVKATGDKTSCIVKLRDFLRRESKEANNPVLRVCKELEAKERAPKPSTKRDGATKGSTGSAFSTAVMSCFICGSDSHAAYKCNSFKQKSAKDRIELLKKEGRCFNCFSDKHRSNACTMQSFCKKQDCGWRSPHSWFVHDQRDKEAATASKAKNSRPQEPKEKTEVANACQLSERKAFLQVVPIKAWTPKNPGKSVTCWAMLDPCSSAHFGCKKLVELLNIMGKPHDVKLRTMHGTKSQRMMVSDVCVKGIEMSQEFKLQGVKFQNSDDLSLSSVPRMADSERWPELKPLVGKVELDEVLLLIGLEARDIFTPLRDGPCLVETSLGKAVRGLVGEGISCESSNFVEVEDDVSLEARVKKFFDIEDCQALYDESKAMSIEDRKAMKMIKESVKKSDGRYEVRVPWRSLPPSMPNNRHQALNRMKSLRGKFLHAREGLQEYAKAISEYEKNGFSERVPDDELAVEDGKASWLCHHGVRHNQKPLRIVFNASKLCEGKSLNTEILQGPDLLSKLIGILLRFRRHQVVVSADIKAFFHQVRIPKSDSDFQRYLWFEDSDPQKKIIEMRMLVHLFGGISSQTCSVAALQECIQDAEKEGKIEKTQVQAAIKSFYCDDFLRSFRNVEEAKTFSMKLKEILKDGGFQLVKFISTDLKVLEDLPKEDIAVACREVNSLKGIRSSALGIGWDVGNDTLSFPAICKTPNFKMTKREVLSMIASIFDPLGLLGPVVATAKMALSAIFRLGLDWDDPLPNEESCVIASWVKSLDVLGNFMLPRCIEGPAETLHLELHLFSDGAEPGYGCCAYAVFVHEKGRTSSLLMSKSKVCSKKGKLTTPKVELCAALLATRVSRIIQRELEDTFSLVCFWTDSMSTLKMVKNDKTRFKVFEANRLEEIRSCTDPSSWRYVPGRQNPSDVLTRPFQLDESFDRSHFFIKGPQFIEQDEKNWPDQPDFADEDVAQEECNLAEAQEWNLVDDLFPRISSWSKIKKFTAVMIRLQRIRKMSNPTKGRLTVEELSCAEISVFKGIQEHYFKEELELVKSGKLLPKSHHLSKYNVFLLDGLLRISGRLQEADLEFDVKHPIILPKKGHLTELLVRTIHLSNLHGTPQMVLNCLRQKFHVPDALRLIKKVVRSCFECKRYTQRLGEQIMANLPPDRMAFKEPPFSHTGCDVAGPFVVKRGRSAQKRYICLFTCLTVRAVHLEVLENLEADTFINAFRRFLARRGPIKTLRTDNGLNFRGGEREIREAIEEWNSSDIGARPEFRNPGIDWKFQTPKASSHSGVWERLIRSMRSHLRHVLKSQDVAEDVFNTLVVEIEGILNSRPLVPTSEEPDDATAITPSMLINMKPSCVMAPGLFGKDDVHLRKRWRQVQAFADFFWRRFLKEYVATLISRQKWVRARRNFARGDVVLIADELSPRSQWPLGIVVKTFPDKQNFVRSCKVKTKLGVYERPINKLALLEASE